MKNAPMTEPEYKRRRSNAYRTGASVSLGSYTSSGTVFLRDRLGEVSRGAYWILPTPHAPYDEFRSRTQPHSDVIIIYSDPRNAFVSLMGKAMRQTSRRNVRTKMGAHMEHFGYTAAEIEKFEEVPFLETTDPAEWRSTWSQFDGFHRFFNSWFSSSRPGRTRFIKYECLRDAETLAGLGSFLGLNSGQKEELSHRIRVKWIPRESNYQKLDEERQKFLNDHFDDLLTVQERLS